MHSERYLTARKEFINCLVFTVFTFGVSAVIAFKEWYPVMQEEKQQEQKHGQLSASRA